MKYLIAALLFISLSEDSFAQLAVGIQGGPNFSSVQFRNREGFLVRNVKLIETYHFGGVVRYMSEKHAGLQLEFNVTQKGWRDINDTSNVQTTRKISYYEVPLLTQFTIGNGKVRILIEGGAYVAYASFAEEEEINLDTEAVLSSEEGFQENIHNRWDYGLMARTGLQFYFPFGAFEAKAFYSYGYGNIYLDKIQALELSQNRVYGLTVSYLYFFGKPKSNSDPE